MSNCVIDLGDFDNVMPTQVAKALGLTITSSHGKCYSMNSTQVPIVDQIKDAQVALALYPKKRLKLVILTFFILIIQF